MGANTHEAQNNRMADNPQEVVHAKVSFVIFFSFSFVFTSFLFRSIEGRLLTGFDLEWVSSTRYRRALVVRSCGLK